MDLARKILAGLLLCLAGGTAVAATFKIATVAPEGTAWMREMRHCADRIEERTGGRVEFKYYPGGVMGTSDTVRRKMHVGQLHGGAFTGGELAEVNPDFFLYSLPFLFRSEAEVQHVRSRLDPILAEGLDKKGMVLLGLAGGGFVYLMSDHRVTTIPELTRSKVWVPEGDPISELAFEQAGVSPVPIPLSDVYTALQTGVIDTVLNTPVGFIAFQWHTRMRYAADFPVAYVLGAMALDKRAYERLSVDDQEVVRDEVGKTFRKLEDINFQDNVDARQALVNQGISFEDLEPDQLKRWRDVGRATIESLREDDMGIENLDALVRSLENYRNSGASR